jgi:hypothetical protein
MAATKVQECARRGASNDLITTGTIRRHFRIPVTVNPKIYRDIALPITSPGAARNPAEARRRLRKSSLPSV